MTSWGMDKVVFNTFHLPSKAISQSIFLSFATAILSSNGGGLWTDALNLLSDTPFQIKKTPTFLSNTIAGQNKRSQLGTHMLLSCLYYLILNPCGALPWAAAEPDSYNRVFGHAVICTLHVLITLRGLLFPSADVGEKVCAGVMRILNIPPVILPKEREKVSGKEDKKKKS